MNKKGFTPILLLIVIGILLVGGFILFGSRSSTQDTETNKTFYPTVVEQSPSEVSVPSELVDMTCDTMQASFKLPSNFEKYEETNAQGELVCLFSDKIQNGKSSSVQIALTVFATKNTKSALGVTSRQAAEQETKRFGGMTDLPEEVIKKGSFAIFHIIAPDALKNTATWYVDSISNDETDTYYTVTLSVPKSLQHTVNAQQIMDGYVLSDTF